MGEMLSAAETHLRRGRRFAVQGMHAEAIREYERALEMDPHFEPARLNLTLMVQIAQAPGVSAPPLMTRKGRATGK